MVMKQKKERGFTLIELMVVIAIMAVLFGIAIPVFSRWQPEAALKRAARDLYSNMQLARITAIRQYQQINVTFDTVNNSYTISGINKTVDLDDYGFGITYSRPAGDPGSVVTQNPITFDPKGISNNAGSVYISNSYNTSYYRITTNTSGVITLKKWNGAGWD